ncbi:hypothetical protein CKA38_14650 [Ereboglobus luteus]|uniref:Uncharacterized protein n=1 Tax=Ereboglobus luteus TaxID=1796921 RepID=A0A2U8E687_9BACT|nr:hypothetical protein CKA38_14650 [Ereboglobus luteus]
MGIILGEFFTIACKKSSKKTDHGKWLGEKPKTTMKGKNMTHPNKEMTGQTQMLEQMMTLLLDDDPMRMLLQVIVQEVLEPEMKEMLCAHERQARLPQRVLRTQAHPRVRNVGVEGGAEPRGEARRCLAVTSEARRR